MYTESGHGKWCREVEMEIEWTWESGAGKFAARGPGEWTGKVGHRKCNISEHGQGREVNAEREHGRVMGQVDMERGITWTE